LRAAKVIYLFGESKIFIEAYKELGNRRQETGGAKRRVINNLTVPLAHTSAFSGIAPP